MRQRRKYPFTERQSTYSDGTSVSNNFGTVTWNVTVWKENPFHGTDRWLFAFDEWGHRKLPWLWQRWPMKTFCSWWDDKLQRREEVRAMDRGVRDDQEKRTAVLTSEAGGSKPASSSEHPPLEPGGESGFPAGPSLSLWKCDCGGFLVYGITGWRCAGCGKPRGGG